MPEAPGQYSSANSTLTGAVNGLNRLFSFSSNPTATTVAPFLNGLLMTQTMDVTVLNDVITMAVAQTPQSGDTVTVRAWVPDANGINAPVQYSSATGSLTGVMNGVNATFVLNLPQNTLGNGLPVTVTQVSLWWNGLFMTPGKDYTYDGVSTITMLHGQFPQTGDTLTAQVYLA